VFLLYIFLGEELSMTEFGWLSIVPPVVAIVLAIVTKNVIVSLFSGVVAGLFIYTGGSVTATFTETFELMVGSMADGEWNARILLTVALMGGLVGILGRSGASLAFARYAQSRVRNKRGAGVITVLAGLFIFFDDYFNSLTVGSVMRPVTDRFKLSREKLAYFIDSTAAPVCVLVPLSTWAAYILSLIAAEYAKIGQDVSPLQIFLRAVPFNIYSWVAIGIVGFVAYTGYNFGPMAKAEAEAEAAEPAQDLSDRTETSSSGLIDIVLPVATLIVATFVFMLALGGFFSGAGFAEAFEATDSATAMMYGAFTAIFVGVVWYALKKSLSLSDSMDAMVEGMKSMMISMVVLILAWSIGGVTDYLGTGDFVAHLVSGNIPTFIIPMVAFLAACLIAFSTGTSWGTFAIMLPIAVPMAVSSGLDIPMMIGAVLAGGIFGDHCSPISDTTILSSTGADCNHIEHVRTQLPYALLGALAAAVGFVIAGITGSSLISLAASLLAAVGALYWLSKGNTPPIKANVKKAG
jgi:Na+/H+ antiporter NhaC